MNNLTDLQKSALDLIKAHPNSLPITGKEIAEAIGLKERDSGKEGADMRSIVYALRVKGYWVCANGRGYFYAADLDELSQYIDSLTNRINSEIKAVNGLRGAFNTASEAKKEAVKTVFPNAYPGIPHDEKDKLL